ncbi:histidine phosphatase family protein [Tropicimonas marinistellae]|uniref:histidine phosphatase family protein n=1 Tax=Tropicimonas marinistellae TaxID=1739787 RepID=UPI00083732A0|nr:histidine phosphatase family protein [Tropicimonas marinistellae]
MARLLYLSHPEVEIDPEVPVPDWGLSATGVRRVRNWIDSGVFDTVTRVVSSAERKAVETAKPIARARQCEVEVRPATHENDRSATGYLPAQEFEEVANAFFANPESAVRGWETAVAAQTRIVSELDAVLARPVSGDLLMVGHGGVGTLLYCHLAGLAIDRRHDQTGGGCLWALTLPSRSVVHGWRAVETLISGSVRRH